MTLHSQGQRFQATHDQKAVERSSNCPDGILQKGNLIGQFLVFTNHDYPANHIRMSIQVFRRGMDYHIETGFDWSLDPWRGEGVVGNRNDLVFACHFGNRFKINDLKQRITRCFHPDHPRI